MPVLHTHPADVSSFHGSTPRSLPSGATRRLLAPVLAALMAAGAGFARPAAPSDATATVAAAPVQDGSGSSRKPPTTDDRGVRELPMGTTIPASKPRVVDPQSPPPGAANVGVGRTETVDQTPVLRFEPEVLEFGEMEPNVAQTRTVKVINVSDKVITISRAIPSCGCTTPVWPKDPIPPGGSGDMEVTLKPNSNAGLLQKTITLQVDGYAPVRYTLRGTVPEYIRVTPVVLMAPGTADQPYTETVTLKSMDEKPFRISNVIPAIFNDEQLREAAEKPALEHTLAIDWNKWTESGSGFRAQFTTDHPKSPPLHVTIRRPIERSQASGANMHELGTTPTATRPSPRTMPTSLVFAAQRGDVDEVRRRLAAGDDPNAVDPSSLRTALHWAAEKNNVEIIDLLIEKGANMRAGERVGRTPLALAAASGSLDAMRRLIAANADINARDDHGGSPILWAAGQGTPEAVQLLIEAGADPNIQDANGLTPLLWAANIGETRIVEVLASNPKVQINVADRDGETALMRAARNGKVDAVRLLIERGADVNARNRQGMTALLFASETGNLDTVKAIAAAKPDVTAKRAQRGQNALDLAMARKDDEGRRIAEYLARELKLQPSGTVASTSGSPASSGGSKGG